MRLYEVIWKYQFIEKIATKHEITTSEIEQLLFGNPHVRKVERGRVRGENVYLAYGCTEAGRYLVVLFIYKHANSALPISARNMSKSERKYYDQQK